ncbi:NAD-dependent succinate-semialdehyde dehydrogenase [Gallaecimonas mangrovi]|uniref:NAD-dependent succinate-semialdehyde dehydrogenase n=1 Tax=Gallaecimonas mangrovi TaxID=2291597 RepID=UPI000E1FF904|nr:NAD-dependent succinate-semialdehyde dehydrogenase [Gallaecimonas mangrovi]
MAYATTNPYTGEQLKTFPEASDQEVSKALASADNAFNAWHETPIAERSKVLKKACDLLRERAQHYAELITLEMGKRISEAKAELAICADIFEYYAEHAQQQLSSQEVLREDGIKAKVVNEPIGTVLAVEPWNFPFYQVARIAAPQIAIGNSVILKHASIVPQCAGAFEQLLLDAGLPLGGFQNLYASKAQIHTLINDPRVQGVALTGSEAAGAKVAAQAGEALKKSTLELGGSDAFIVLEDADLERAAELAVSGRNSNAGQVCTASKRFIVVDSVYDPFLALYKQKAAQQLKAGDPMDEATTLSPLSSQEAADNLYQQIEAAQQQGAKVEDLGIEVPSQGAFVKPVVISNVTSENPAYYQEFFGPAAMFFRARNEDDAVRIANDSPYGLGGSVYTEDIERGSAVAAKVSSGMVFVNHPTQSRADLPFGGIRRSGYGRELTGLGLKEFVNQKLIAVVDSGASV